MTHQPRSLELFEFLGIIDPVMERSIKPPTVRVYKGPEGVEILKEFEMAPVLEPMPAKPYVFEFKIVTKEVTDSTWGAAKLSSPWPAEFGKYNSNRDEEI